MSSLITPEYFTQQMATLGLKSAHVPNAEAMDTLIIEASDWVEAYCDRKFEEQEFTETLQYPFRRYNSTIILDNWPVSSVDSIDWQDSAGQTGSYAANLVYVDSSGVVGWLSPSLRTWDGHLRWTITYTAGYATIPSNVQRAVALKVAHLIQPAYQGVQDREVFMVSNLESMIIDLLEQFRRERIG